MAREWPTGGDHLLWMGYGLNTVAQVVFARSPGLVEPALAMQVVTRGCCLRSLLQQRQAARAPFLEPNNVEAIVEHDDKEEASPLPFLTAAAAAPAVGLDRSVSNASSTGTPGGSTPLSAHGSVLGPFSAPRSTKFKGKSPLGDSSRQGSADRAGLNPKAKAWVPGSSGLNPEAAPWVPNYKPPRDLPRRKRHASFGLRIEVKTARHPSFGLRVEAGTVGRALA